MALAPKWKGLFVALGVVALLAGYQYIRYWWFHGYSIGERTGVIRKMSVKGSPLCKYLEGELVLSGSVPGQAAEVWTFSIDDHRDSNPLMQQLHEAERDAQRVTLHYRQDLKSWYRCTPQEYFITGVERSPLKLATEPSKEPSK